MTRLVTLAFSGLDEEVEALLLDEEEPELAGLLWDDLAEPLRMWTWHTTSSGDFFSAKGRPPAHPTRAGTQASPLGRARLMCDVEPGSVVYSGSKTLSFAYGPEVTEPLPCKGPVVARAVDGDAMWRAGRHVYRSHFGAHQLVTVIARRGGKGQ